MSRRMIFQVTAAAATTLVLAAGLAPTAAVARTRAHAAASKTINVTAVDFHFRLSSSSAKPGKVTFKIVNRGKVQHDFRIDGTTSKLISPGQHTSITVDFKKKGSYYYECTVPGHAALGMKGYFKIT